jgi:glycosyltransferase involved in cell wall biosynthesis
MIIKHCAKVSQYYRQNDFAKTIKRIFTVLIGRQQAPLQKGSPQIKNLLSAIDYTDHNVNKKSADYRPLVTIIVPNYNHANFLHERLDSIYAQTYDNFQVILMDDCSTDDSVNILEQYKNRYPAKTAIYKNDVNGGTPFRQWKKGIGLAEGELVWIAESDDTCDKSFLEALVPFFRNPGVRLAYANTLLMLEGHPHITMRQYLHEVVVDFSGTFVCSAHQFVRHFLSWLNAIPNASAVVFRKDKELALIADNEWQSLRLCGDWLFYLAQIRGGLLAFTDKTQCYYRIHQQGSTNKIQKMALLYEEHWIIANFLAKNYWLLPGWFDKFKYKVYVSCVQNVENFDAKNFNRLLDKQKIFELSLYRKKIWRSL